MYAIRSYYVDCRQEFIDAMEKTINLGTVMGAEKNQPIQIHAPFVNKTKSEEIAIGMQLGVDYGLTWSCYNGGVITSYSIHYTKLYDILCTYGFGIRSSQ